MPCAAKLGRTGPSTRWPPASCWAGWHTLPLGLPTGNCRDWLQGVRALFSSWGAGGLGGRQAGSEAMSRLGSAILLEDSADCSPLGGHCCPSRKRHLLDPGGG